MNKNGNSLFSTSTKQHVLNRTVNVHGVVDEKLMNDCIDILKKIELVDEINKVPVNKRKKITVNINSPGGIIYYGLGLYDCIKNMIKRGYVIETVCDSGIAMSMGSVLLVAGSVRKISKHSTVMIHCASSGTYGQLQTMIEDIDETNRLWESLKLIFLENTNITEYQLNDIKQRKYDWFIDSEQAKTLGVVDEIL